MVVSAAETVAAWGLALGALVFSGSLVLLGFTGNARWGAVTPIGGVLLLMGWAALIAAAFSMTSVPSEGFLRLIDVLNQRYLLCASSRDRWYSSITFDAR